MNYQHLTEVERDDTVMEAIIHREKEHYHYELNKLAYENAIAEIDKDTTIPKSWPKELEPYRKIYGENLVDALMSANLMDKYNIVTKLQFKDKLNMMLATGTTEQAKVELIHRALDKQMPSGDRRSQAKNRILLKLNKQ